MENIFEKLGEILKPVKTKVKFVMENAVEENGKKTVLALFPEVIEGKDRFACYAHIGQHSYYDIGYENCCDPATPEEYKDLKEELESIGYNLEII